MVLFASLRTPLPTMKMCRVYFPFVLSFLRIFRHCAPNKWVYIYIHSNGVSWTLSFSILILPIWFFFSPSFGVIFFLRLVCLHHFKCTAILLVATKKGMNRNRQRWRIRLVIVWLNFFFIYFGSSGIAMLVFASLDSSVSVCFPSLNHYLFSSFYVCISASYSIPFNMRMSFVGKSRQHLL